MCPGVWTVQCLRIFVSYGFYTELRGNKQETLILLAVPCSLTLETPPLQKHMQSKWACDWGEWVSTQPCVLRPWTHAFLPIYDNSLFSWIACCQSAVIPMSQVDWVSHSGLTWQGVWVTGGGTDALAIEVGMRKQRCGTVCVGARSAARQGMEKERHQTGLFRMHNNIPGPRGFSWGKGGNQKLPKWTS